MNLIIKVLKGDEIQMDVSNNNSCREHKPQINCPFIFL